MCGAYDPEILEPIVESIAVDMIELDHYPAVRRTFRPTARLHVGSFSRARTNRFFRLPLPHH